MNNALSIDLEDYFHVSAYDKRVRKEDWDTYPSRVEQNVDRLLQLFDQHNHKATFFVLGWVAEKKPWIVARVASAGHEVACHSLWHRRVYDLTPEEFREDTRRAKAAIEDAAGKRVLGYRAPSFTITRKSAWALEILAAEGFQYDSSVFPVQHPTYGIADSPRTPYWINTPSGKLLEFPLASLRLGKMRAPLGGGAYLRLLPYRFTLWSIRYLNEHENSLACVYIHPWELDPEQPRLGGSLSARMRHYIGLNRTEQRFTQLLHDFKFCPLASFMTGSYPNFSLS